MTNHSFIARLSPGLTALLLLALSTPTLADDPVREGPRPINAAEHGVGRLVADLAFTDLAGRKGKLSDYGQSKAVVIALTNTSCPLCQKFAPALARLESAYRGRGVSFIYLNPSEADTPADMRASVKAHGFHGPYVHDPSGKLASRLGAVTTTDVFVLDSARTLVYRGAVSDQYGLGYALDAPRADYLADALDAVLAGEHPATAATWAPGCVLALDAPAAKSASVTYHNRVSRIVQQHCVECHRKDGIAPFSLATYKDVHANRGMIEFVLKRDVMPPWFAAKAKPGHASPWANDRTLPDADKRDLLAWLKSGLAEGDPGDAPLPRTFASDWQIGDPDLIVPIPRPVDVKAEGVMPYVNVQAKTSFKEDRWVQAVEVMPTARSVVHHVLVFAIAPPKANARPGERARRRANSSGYFAAYVPGNSHKVYPGGLAKLLPAGATLHFQLHYTPNGKAARDQTRVGLVFSKTPPKHRVRTVGISNRRISIPPRADNHAETARIPVPAQVKLLSLMPHMHVRGKAFRYEAVLPGGERQRLLDVPRYDFNWQLAYQFADPPMLPRGSRVEVTGWFDNSADNPANPDPSRTVHWGKQTNDEMLIGYVEYYVPLLGLK